MTVDYDNKTIYKTPPASTRDILADADAIVGLKKRWQDATDDAGRQYAADQAAGIYDRLRYAGRSDVADQLASRGYTDATRYLDTLRGESYTPDAAGVQYKSNDAYGQMGNAIRDYTDRYDRLYYERLGDPYQQAYGNRIMSDYGSAADSMYDKTLGAGIEAAGGNADSYAAAQANRNKAAVIQQGHEDVRALYDTLTGANNEAYKNYTAAVDSGLGRLQTNVNADAAAQAAREAADTQRYGDVLSAYSTLAGEGIRANGEIAAQAIANIGKADAASIAAGGGLTTGYDGGLSRAGFVDIGAIRLPVAIGTVPAGTATTVVQADDGRRFAVVAGADGTYTLSEITADGDMLTPETVTTGGTMMTTPAADGTTATTDGGISPAQSVRDVYRQLYNQSDKRDFSQVAGLFTGADDVQSAADRLNAITNGNFTLTDDGRLTRSNRGTTLVAVAGSGYSSGSSGSGGGSSSSSSGSSGSSSGSGNGSNGTRTPKAGDKADTATPTDKTETPTETPKALEYDASKINKDKNPYIGATINDIRQ